MANPLTLAGFVVFLFFAIHRLLIKNGIIPPVSRTQAPKIVRLFLSYGFAAAVLIIIAGFGLQAYQSHLEAAGPSAIQQETQGAASPAVANTKGDVTITVAQPPAPSSEKKR